MAESHWVDGLSFSADVFKVLGFLELVVVMALVSLLVVSRVMAFVMLGGVLSLEEACRIARGSISAVFLLV